MLPHPPLRNALGPLDDEKTWALIAAAWGLRAPQPSQMCSQTPQVQGPPIPLLQTLGLDEASLDLHCGVPMETCKVASCIVYEAATVCLTVLVVAQERLSGPKLLRASGGSGRPIWARSVFLQAARGMLTGVAGIADAACMDPGWGAILSC